MNRRLRILIEIDGEAWIDQDIVVSEVKTEHQNGVRQVQRPFMVNNEYEPDGNHSITIDYRDVLA